MSRDTRGRATVDEQTGRIIRAGTEQTDGVGLPEWCEVYQLKDLRCIGTQWVLDPQGGE